MDLRTIPPADTLDGTVAKTTVTSFRVVEALKRKDGAGVTELAAELDVAKGTVHKHLTTLQKIDYVVKEGKQYHLGVGFLGLGVTARSRLEIHQPAKGPLEELVTTAGKPGSIMVPEMGYGLYISQRIPEDGREPPFRVGDRMPLHATAGGKAMFAYTPEEERERIIENRGLTAWTEETITREGALQEELDQIHDTRIAYERGELVEGWGCIASPITTADDVAVGAISISAPLEELSSESVDDTDTVYHIRNAAFNVTRKLE